MESLQVQVNAMNFRRMVSYSGAAVLSRPVARYILRQRDRLEPHGLPLPKEIIARLHPYFEDLDLGRARIVIADPLPIPNPPFSTVVHCLGFDFPSAALTAAITFDHVIATREPMGPALLFHELVHLVQYRLLGVPLFARQYVQGFLAGGSYHRIPLEDCAFDLERRFVTESRPFRVEAEVLGWMDRFRL
jgi:hypothetical protein